VTYLTRQAPPPIVIDERVVKGGNGAPQVVTWLRKLAA
jgi:hypothetical protein